MGFFLVGCEVLGGVRWESDLFLFEFFVLFNGKSLGLRLDRRGFGVGFS